MVAFENTTDIIEHLNALGELPNQPYIIGIHRQFLDRHTVAIGLEDTQFRVDWQFVPVWNDDWPWMTIGIRPFGIEDLVCGNI